MGKINGKNLWGKLMGEIYGEKKRENLLGKLMVLFNIANLLKNSPISSNKGYGNEICGDFQQ